MLKRMIICVAILAGVLILPAHAEKMSLTITVVKGTVDIQPPGQTEWRRAVEGKTIFPSMSIRTGADGEAVIVWGDGNAVKIQSLSTFHINEAEARDDVMQSDMKLDTGSVYATARKLAGDESYFQVRTPSAIAGVRGTDFFGQVLEGGESTFGVMSGEIFVSAGDIEITLVEDMIVNVAADGVISEPEPLPVEVKREADQKINEAKDQIKAPIQEESQKPAETQTAPVNELPEPVSDAVDQSAENIMDNVNTSEEQEILDMEYLTGTVNVDIDFGE